MRGVDACHEALFTTVRPEDFVPASHPLRPIRKWVNEALAKMDAKFSAMYDADIKGGCPCIAPEKLQLQVSMLTIDPWKTKRGGQLTPAPAHRACSRPINKHR